MRRQIAFLSQRHSLLGGSILDNLSGFDVPRNGERAIALARKLGIEGVLRDNGEALSERTAEAAEAKLSASLVNAICIVRALAADPTAILFDEANLSLDRELDQKLLGYLAEIKPAKAMVIVSHRPSYLALADRVYELRSGRLLQVYEADRAGRRGWWRRGAEGEAPRLANAS
jgi:ABC-type bacteriocin/lantibiotic exporter with double-glycine peptidase domain